MKEITILCVLLTQSFFMYTCEENRICFAHEGPSLKMRDQDVRALHIAPDDARALHIAPDDARAALVYERGSVDIVDVRTGQEGFGTIIHEGEMGAVEDSETERKRERIIGG